MTTALHSRFWSPELRTPLLRCHPLYGKVSFTSLGDQHKNADALATAVAGSNKQAPISDPGTSCLLLASMKLLGKLGSLYIGYNLRPFTVLDKTFHETFALSSTTFLLLWFAWPLYTQLKIQLPKANVLHISACFDLCFAKKCKSSFLCLFTKNNPFVTDVKKNCRAADNDIFLRASKLCWCHYLSLLKSQRSPSTKGISRRRDSNDGTRRRVRECEACSGSLQCFRMASASPWFRRAQCCQSAGVSLWWLSLKGTSTVPEASGSVFPISQGKNRPGW